MASNRCVQKSPKLSPFNIYFNKIIEKVFKQLKMAKFFKFGLKKATEYRKTEKLKFFI